MIGNNILDELDCGSFFDHIDDLLDFPVEDVDAGFSPPANGGDLGNSFPTIWPTHSESLPGSAPVFLANGNSDLSAELSVPYEDIVQLEWLSNFVEDSFCGGSHAMNKEEQPKDLTRNQFQTSSPVSVLESSSSCSSDKSLSRSPESTVANPAQLRGRARSKRPRPATFSPRIPIQLISPASSVTETTHDQQASLQLAPKAPLDSDNFAESRPLIKMPKHSASGMPKKNKKIKLSFSLTPFEGANQSAPSQSVRKCMHCEITKTPQWRAGPMGPKTLCNACGVRYKSGRLFPEYRPAASPTFIPLLHSNSHKKVLEMRSKTDEPETGANAITISLEPELIPNTNSAISMDYI